MRTGVLARLEPNLTVTTQVALAVTEFVRASHTKGLTPSEGSVQVLGNPNQAEEKDKIDRLLARGLLLKGVIIDDLQSKLGWLRISAGLIAAASESKCDAGSGKELLG